jgi:two-component system LytT family response regulator
MKAIIIDDEPLARMMVKEYLHPYANIEIVAECNDGFEGVKAINQYQPDLIFLDIQMPKITGFEMLELIDNPPKVIFTTAFEEFAIKAFEAHAVDYLLKPFSKERFDKAMSKLLLQQRTAVDEKATQDVIETAAQAPAQANRIVVKDGGKIKIIPITQVQYLEAADDYVRIYTADGKFLKKKTMGFFEASLPTEQFVRVHRSFIINTSLITRIDPYEKDSHLALLSTGAKIAVSRSGYAKLKEVLGI